MYPFINKVLKDVKVADCILLVDAYPFQIPTKTDELFKVGKVVKVKIKKDKVKIYFQYSADEYDPYYVFEADCNATIPVLIDHISITNYQDVKDY